jgi:hypothetical protein
MRSMSVDICASAAVLAHPPHVDLLINARDVLGDAALQQAVVLGDEGKGLVISDQIQDESVVSTNRSDPLSHRLRRGPNFLPYPHERTLGP